MSKDVSSGEKLNTPAETRGLGFTLHYEDYDRGGTFGATTVLQATTIEGAITEARTLLANMQAQYVHGLPKQRSVWITQQFSVPIDDIGLGPKVR